MATKKSLGQQIDEARKAVAGFVVPGLIMLGTALREGSDSGTTITAAEWVEVFIAALLTSGVVYGIKNGESKDPTTSTPEA